MARKAMARGRCRRCSIPRPRNFACAQTVNGIPDGQLFWIVRFGSPGTSMPPHPAFSDEQVWKVVAYLRRLAR
jgi:cytochrome c1